jgi:hypothetical protein
LALPTKRLFLGLDFGNISKKSMIRLITIFVALAAALPSLAQVSEPGSESATTSPAKTGTRADIPGTFVLELGINNGLDAPQRFDVGFWGSRTLNVYYTYELRVLNSKFSVVPGIGLSLERFKFKNGATLGYDADSLELFLPSETPNITGERKSQLITNYFDLPLEIRFTSNPSDPNRAVKIGIGGRIGYLYDAFTKMKYKPDGDMKQFKDKQNFNLTRFRYGVFGRAGIGNFSLFAYYNLNPLFEKGNGLWENRKPVDFSTITVGFSLAAF